MMKKKLNVILIIVVVGLWGIVGYRFFKNSFYKPDTTMAITSARNTSGNLVIKRNSFDLMPISRDPFLDGQQLQIKPLSSPRSKSAKPANSVKQTANENTTPVKWPDIEYFGYIKSEKSTELALLKIDGKTLKGSKGFKYQNLTIKDIYKDSLKVTFFNQVQIVRRPGIK